MVSKRTEYEESLMSALKVRLQCVLQKEEFFHQDLTYDFCPTTVTLGKKTKPQHKNPPKKPPPQKTQQTAP